MKKLTAFLALLLVGCLLLTACGETTPGESTPAPDAPSEATATPEPGSSTREPAAPTPEPTPVPEKITEKTDYVTEQWIAVDIPFTATADIKYITEAAIDVTFKNRSTGTTMVMPGFWDAKTDWKVRFAPTECGIWDFSVKATGTDLGLDGKTGTLAANPYTGDLELYKHGFVKTLPDTKYFVYADGTPFFYLGDTHWTMLTEEFDKPGAGALDTGAESHFKYIVDKRVEQGFTVYQSEPIGSTFDVSDGKISSADVKGFQKLDKYFAYIAEKGLVHANAELIFPSSATKTFADAQESLVRYWVARYSAYPVLWTLGQEVDNGSNYEGKNGVENIVFTYIGMAKYLHQYDAYQHPLSAHQLNTSSIGCSGNVPVASVDGGYSEYDPAKNSRSKAKTNKGSSFGFTAEGYSWWAAQWRPCVDQQYNFGLAKDYWVNGRGMPAIDYEARYHYLSTKDFGARAQAWIALLAGMCGAAYGAEDMWYYNSSYDIDTEANDGVDTITPEEKRIKWGELINGPISGYLTILKNFFTSRQWWRLVPDFDDGTAYRAGDNASVFYSAAHIGTDEYIVYFYNRDVAAGGSLTSMDPYATYTVQWFDPVTGEYTAVSDSVTPAGATADYAIPEKPLAQDMVLLVTKN